MFKTILMALGLMVSISAKANDLQILVGDINNVILADANDRAGFSWKEGDAASYNLKMGFISGKMVVAVKSVAADAVVISQDLDLSFMGKQSCEITINPNTGETKKMVCNGQEQDTGGAGNFELIESKEASVTVPAGTFTCLYIRAKDSEKNQEIQQWINPKLIPVLGMAKSIVPSQMGEVVLELTSFKKN